MFFRSKNLIEEPDVKTTYCPIPRALECAIAVIALPGISSFRWYFVSPAMTPREKFAEKSCVPLPSQPRIRPYLSVAKTISSRFRRYTRIQVIALSACDPSSVFPTARTLTLKCDADGGSGGRGSTLLVVADTFWPRWEALLGNSGKCKLCRWILPSAAPVTSKVSSRRP